MGCCSRILRFSIISTLVVLLIVLLPNIPPDIQFTEFQVPPSRSLEGNLAINTLLNNPDKMFVDEIKGPESFAVLNGDLYTTLHGGYVVKVYDDQIVPVVKFGQPCDGWWEESKCGRPLGIAATADNHLVVADAYYGIFKHNVETGRTVQLVTSQEEVAGRRPRLFNGVDVAKDGSVFWTDSSSDFQLQDGLYSFLGDPTGRLVRYDPKTKKNEVLIDGLHFPNGVVLSHDEDFVLVAETARNTIHKFHLKGPRRNTREVLVDDLPGLPDNLRRNAKGGYIVSLVLAKDPQTPVLAHAINPFPNIRKFFARTLALVELAAGKIHELYPSYYTARVTHFVGHFEMTKSLAPLRGSVLEMDGEGRYLESYHNTDGSMTAISDAILHDGYLYLGSPYSPFLARVRSSKLISKLSGPKPTTTTTTPKPTTTTTTTPRPTTTTTPKPTTTTTKPTTTTPKPTTTAPKPTTTTPKPTTTTPKPTTTTPKPTTTAPKPTTTTPRPPTTTTQKPKTEAPTTTPKQPPTQAPPKQQPTQSKPPS